jgi:glycosyltransferase involved in cell wall biosynthesis
MYARIRRAHALLSRMGCRLYVLYVWRCEFDQAVTASTFDLTCYHIDDDYSFSDSDQPVTDREARLLASVGQVFVHSPGLLQKHGHMNPHVAFVPNGVDYQAYSRPVPIPVDLARIPAPRIGYTGFIKKQLDWPLLMALVQDHPEWSFVFVGPRSTHREIEEPIRMLQQRPNVHFLGPKPPTELPAYAQHFSVCIMPYRHTAYTGYIYPLKLHEYLATGQPVVGTSIRSLREFAHVVRLADEPKDWSAALRQSLHVSANNVAQRAARQEVARRHDWDALVERIAQTMLGRLETKLPGRSFSTDMALASEQGIRSQGTAG